MSLLLVSFLFWGAGELERNSFIALPGEGGHSRLMPSRLCVSPWLGYGKVFFFSPIICISWRLITLQYCSGFCCTLTWISHGFTCVPHPEPPSHLPLHPIPLGHPSAPAPSTCLMHPTWTGDLFHTWWYTCFDVLSDHPTLAFSHRVQKSVLYICVSFSILHIGLSLPSF